MIARSRDGFRSAYERSRTAPAFRTRPSKSGVEPVARALVSKRLHPARSEKPVPVRVARQKPTLVRSTSREEIEPPESFSYDLRTGQLVRSVRVSQGNRRISSPIGLWPGDKKLPNDLASAADAERGGSWETRWG